MKLHTTITLGWLYLCLCFFPGWGFERKIELGKADNWQDLILFEDVTRQEGRWGYQDLVLEDAQRKADKNSDLWLPFDKPGFNGEDSHYLEEGPPPLISDVHKVYGKGSALFRGKGYGLALKPREEALFAPGQLWGDFSIEFWLRPLTLTNGESLLQWNGSRSNRGTLQQQNFTCRLFNRKVNWIFNNLFFSPEGKSTRIELESIRSLLPGKWSHHLLRFDSTNGLLEYLIDGVPEAIVYTTESGREGSSVRLPLTGTMNTSLLTVCPLYTGYLDELYISRTFNKIPENTRYTGKPGMVISKVFDLEYNGSVLKQIEAVYSTPGDSAVYFYYKSAPTRESWNILAGEWKLFSPGNLAQEDTTGRYLQLKLDLYPGRDNETTPAVSAIKIAYEPDLPPSPPSGLRAIPGKGSVTLYWNKVNEYDIGGYLVYYGPRSGMYTAAEGTPGPSPVDAGNTNTITIDALSNGDLYYFAVVAYDNSDPPHQSLFSREISVRPSVLHE